jgi:integrase/recombinase XerD
MLLVSQAREHEETMMSVSNVSGTPGPLEPFRDGFCRFLVAEGYSPKRVELHLALLSHLSGWLGGQGLGPADLSMAVAEEFFELRRRRYSWLTTTRSLSPLLRFLHSVGVTPIGRQQPVSASPAEELVEGYRCHLDQQRGLAAGSIALYLAQIRRVVAVWWPDGQARVGELDAADVVGLVRHQTADMSVASAKTLVCALRSFLRFLHATGRIKHSLVEAVPSVADRRRASLPRHLDPDVVTRLIACCDVTTPMGRRDAAMLTLLARLGLRAGEVAGLRLEEVDWHAGEIVIVGKGRRMQRLPVPVEVGEAITAYLVGGRPTSHHRSLFLAGVAPYGPLSRSAVASVVHRACDRAGLARVGPHRLRHTAATQTLRAGGSMTEVAQLLRHLRVETTATYAKVDHGRLQALALPWPGGGA